MTTSDILLIKIDNILAQYIEPYASMYGMSVEDFVSAAYGGVTVDEFREQQLIPSAEQSLSQEIILGAIGEKEGITITDAELNKILQGYADEFGVTLEEMTEGADMDEVRSQELQLKVMKWLFENVTIEEVKETEETESSFLAGIETEETEDIDVSKYQE